MHTHTLMNIFGFFRNHVCIIYSSIYFLQGIITAPILFAMEEFPQLQAVIEQGFDNPANVDTVSLNLQHQGHLLLPNFILRF